MYCRSTFFRGHHISAVGIQSGNISRPQLRKLLYSVYICIPQKPSLGFSALKISTSDFEKIIQLRKKTGKWRSTVFQRLLINNGFLSQPDIKLKGRKKTRQTEKGPFIFPLSEARMKGY